MDLPLVLHHWWVPKRIIEGFWVSPEGWPEDTPLWASTMSSHKVL
ncbi:hypothetical protein [Roseomonas populi]|uniref:Uncharacterized protein n=1 Tax=Roseomonas populi TaxID=3121582 RepID=A0ABT1XA72_9PROT|nr:hypothetical protein [Roseomonas pecuniae]MCR0984998.1 hypothetical protein [Roseomonas pecuniae]